MNKIISGKRYDTNTAREVYEWRNTYGVRDFHHVVETLYCKKTGEYFLHGQGGPLSKYAESVGNNGWSGGERLIPLTREAAESWLAEVADADDYEKEFGEVEDEDLVMLSVRVPASAKARFDRHCEREGKRRSDVLSELLMSL